MVLWKGWTDAEKMFAQKLKEAGISVTYQDINADQDRSKLATAIRGIEGEIVSQKFNLIYSYGTVATQVTKATVKNNTPVVFNIVFDPVGGNLVTSNKEPGGNITGVTNGVPIPAQFDAFTQLKPIKDLLVLSNSREPNSNIIEREVREWAQKAGVNVISRRVTPDTSSLKDVLDEMKSGKLVVDSLYAGADNYLASVAKEVHEAVGDKVRLYGGTQTYIWGGWLAAYTPLVSDMGATAAEQALKIFKGANPATLPVILPKPKLFVSESAAKKHGVTPPTEAALES
jgi:putative tryptophan/tyrosine transport system substrate-binding protein